MENKNEIETREIYAGDHNESTVIRIIYGRNAGDGRPGLDVVLNGILKARYYRPEDVNAWFENWSKKCLPEWQTAYHNSGLGPSSYDVPNSTPAARVGDFVLPVKYKSQRDNYYDKGGSCNVTMYATIGEFLGATRKFKNDAGEFRFNQLEDDMNRYIKDRRWSRHLHDDLARMGRAYGLNSWFGLARTFAQIENQLRAGLPVGVSGSFTASGHIISIIGMKGRDFVVHDSWGNALKGYSRDNDGRNGAALVYPRAFMASKLKVGNSPEKWAHFFGAAE